MPEDATANAIFEFFVRISANISLYRNVLPVPPYIKILILEKVKIY